MLNLRHPLILLTAALTAFIVIQTTYASVAQAETATNDIVQSHRSDTCTNDGELEFASCCSIQHCMSYNAVLPQLPTIFQFSAEFRSFNPVARMPSIEKQPLLKPPRIS